LRFHRPARSICKESDGPEERFGHRHRTGDRRKREKFDRVDLDLIEADAVMTVPVDPWSLS
jgi:hypothetical protein